MCIRSHVSLRLGSEGMWDVWYDVHLSSGIHVHHLAFQSSLASGKISLSGSRNTRGRVWGGDAPDRESGRPLPRRVHQRNQSSQCCHGLEDVMLICFCSSRDSLAQICCSPVPKLTTCLVSRFRKPTFRRRRFPNGKNGRG